jgi:N-acetylmuramoyl-L-alanine amidase
MRDRSIARRDLLALAGVALIGGSGSAHAARARPQRPRVVAIDPGHGGADPGAISSRGVYEKRVTLAVAFELAHQLARTNGSRPVLTRSRDVFVALRERVARARAAHADVMLSLHADTLPDPGLRGLLVFTLSERASDREVEALARRENGVDRIGGIDLSRHTREIGGVLIDLERRQTGNRSLALAASVAREMGRDVPLIEKPLRSAGFIVLTAPDIPSVLVELGCLSNPDEEKLLSQPAHQKRLAAGLVRALADYWAAEPAF